MTVMILPFSFSKIISHVFPGFLLIISVFMLIDSFCIEPGMYSDTICEDYKLENKDYVIVDEMGRILRSDNLSTRFRQLLKKHDLKLIRFHDLRHSCASLLLANKVSLKQIQEWLGHSNFATTANIYAHLDYSSKIESAETISNILNFNSETSLAPEEINEDKFTLEDTEIGQENDIDNLYDKNIELLEQLVEEMKRGNQKEKDESEM